jgi:hypothetical protein
MYLLPESNGVGSAYKVQQLVDKRRKNNVKPPIHFEKTIDSQKQGE